MKKYIATLRVEVEAESEEVRDDVLWRMAQRINKKPPSIRYDDVGTGKVVSAVVTRVRPKAKKR